MAQGRYLRWGLIVYGICWLGVLARTQFGVDFEDEAYWVATYDQLRQGGIPLMSIWDGHTGFILLLPFFVAYHALVPSLEGIVLFYRVISVLLFSGMALLFAWMGYCGLHHKGQAGSFTGMLLLAMPLLFWTDNLIHLNYNSGAAWMLALLCAWYSFCFADTRRFFFLAGILAGLACIFYPTMLLLAAILGVGAGIYHHRSGGMRHWLFYLWGGVLVGAVFLFYIFSQGSMGEFAAAVEHILHGPHSSYRGPLNLHFFYQTYVSALGHFVVRKSFLLLTGMYIAALYYCRKKLSYEQSALWIPRVFAIYVMLAAWINRSGYGYAIFGVFLAFVLMMAALRCYPWRKGWLFYFVGAMFVLLYSLTSDNKNVLLGVLAGTTLFTAGMMTSILEYLQENRCRWKQALCMILAIAFAGMAHLYLFVYNDASVPQCLQSGKVKQGIYQGIYTTRERRDFIAGMEKAAAEVRPTDRVSVITLEPSLYLMSQGRILAPWTFDAQYLFKGFYSDAPMMDYYRMYQSYPDVIFATDRMEKSRDIRTNTQFQIHALLDSQYTLIRTVSAGEREIYVWRRSDER